GRLAHFGNRLSSLMKLNAVPGAQIAVVKANRLVYSCALGVASLESGTHVEPDHLFRRAGSRR
ncbi:MAG: serine hydrolase, partial [Pseudomonadota bacterium]